MPSTDPCPGALRSASLAMLSLLALYPSTSQAAGFTDPVDIDRAVEGFTGAAPGTPGGARQLADRRLRLAACAGPLAVSWHGATQTAVKVECPGPQSWRIFVAVDNSSSAATTRAEAATVKRGDALTIVVRGRGFSVQQTGEAMESGSVGDWIFVRTARKSEPLRARIERPGLAIIPAV